MEHLVSLSDEPKYLPKQYHHLLAVYASSRCFTQDEQTYLAEQFMNEYEFKTQEIDLLVSEGELDIEGFDGENSNKPFDAVKNVYFIEEKRG